MKRSPEETGELALNILIAANAQEGKRVIEKLQAIQDKTPDRPKINRQILLDGKEIQKAIERRKI